MIRDLLKDLNCKTIEEGRRRATLIIDIMNYNIERNRMVPYSEKEITTALNFLIQLDIYEVSEIEYETI